MTKSKDSSDEIISMDLGQQFTQIITRLVNLQTNVSTIKKTQMRIIAKLEDRDLDEVSSEINKISNEFAEHYSDLLFKSIGFDENTMKKLKSEESN